jgi:hypothetical protein
VCKKCYYVIPADQILVWEMPVPVSGSVLRFGFVGFICCESQITGKVSRLTNSGSFWHSAYFQTTQQNVCRWQSVTKQTKEEILNKSTGRIWRIYPSFRILLQAEFLVGWCNFQWETSAINMNPKWQFPFIFFRKSGFSTTNIKMW